MKHRNKPEARFCRQRGMWVCELAETICETTKEEAEQRAIIKLLAYREATALSVWTKSVKEENNCLKNRVKELQNKFEEEKLRRSETVMMCDLLRAENKRLREALKEASYMIYGELYPDHPTVIKVKQALKGEE